MLYLVQVTFLALAVSGMVLHGMRRQSYSVGWSPRRQEGLSYEYGTQSYRGRSLGFVLRFRAPKGVRFLLRRETWFDRVAKALRLTVEPQMRDEKFDARFYVECEDEALLSAARERPDLLKMMTSLQARMRASGSKLIELRCEDGNLDLVLERDMSTGAERCEEEVLQWLQPLVDAIRSLPPRDEKRFNRGLAARAGFVSIFMIGVIGGFIVSEYFTRRMVDDMALFRFSLPYSLVALAAVLLLTLRWLRHSPGRHRILAACLLVGIPGFVSCGVMAARWLDLSLAQPAPEAIPITKAWLLSSARRGGGTSYRVAFHSEDRRTWNITPILLSSPAYERLRLSWGDQEQRPATLLWYPGALGLPWVELVP